MIRTLLAEVGRWIESLVSPPPSVLDGVAAAREAEADREVDELIASFDELFPVRIGTVAVAGMADRNQSRGGERRPPAAPAPGRPESLRDQIALAIEDHYIAAVCMDESTAQCKCGEDTTLPAHSDHVADVIRRGFDNGRFIAITNKFQK